MENAINQDYQHRLAHAARHASVTEIDNLLDQVSPHLPTAEQILLQKSALAGNPNVFKHILQRNPQAIFTEDIRYYAVTGGVAIWQVLLDEKPECVNWDIGYHGDALGLAVSRKNAPLVRFLLNHGADIHRSNVVGLPVLEFAMGRNIDEDIIQLLIQRGGAEI
ncbi:hypothetical protein N7492_005901 [Penicillium capsulatum]|uniref:Ankyrin repeat domain-containing protein n=1 Tax=Penicillium capsulatum TaxID=69766 RepID=A0A9W9ICQ6_9EURO|nr:hypothetical protein N7492_005901 [Penicillium capsulatum]KAJ6134997.1 hypothetical protein N7512_000157 [Penicillium capsulatum]